MGLIQIGYLRSQPKVQNTIGVGEKEHNPTILFPDKLPSDEWCAGGVILAIAAAVIGSRGLAGSNDGVLLVEYLQFIAWSTLIGQYSQDHCQSGLLWNAW